MAQPRYCPSCKRKVLAEFVWPNYGFHGLLLILTAGMYFPFWLMAMSRQRYVCPRCAEDV